MGGSCGCCSNSSLEQIRRENALHKEAIRKYRNINTDQRNISNDFEEERTFIHKEPEVMNKIEYEQKVMEPAYKHDYPTPLPPKLSNRFSNISKDKCVEYLMNMQPAVIVSVYVSRNVYDRWTLSHKLCEKISICFDLHQPHTEYINGILHVYTL